MEVAVAVGVREPVRTVFNRTFERLLARVEPLMRFQLTTLRELFRAVRIVALIRLLAGMRSQMSLQALASGEDSVTEVTFYLTG